MILIRSNTAVIIAVGPFYDKTDGVTIETALTITNEKITLVAETDAGSAPTLILDNISGATSGTANDLNYITNGDNGMMQMELAAADVNRVGRMKLSITDAANHVPVFHELFVIPQAIYDWWTGVIVPLPANVTQLLGTAWLTPGTAGTPDVNVKQWNALTTVALPLVPTTAGRTLDVSTGGEAGLDWANVGSPTTTLDLSGTTIKTTQKVDVDTIKTNPVVNGGTITFPTTATLASTTNITAGTITTATTATNLTNAPTNGDLTATMKTSVTTAATAATPVAASVTGAVGSVTGNVGGNVVGSVASVTGAVGSVAAGGITASSIAADAIGASELAADAVTEIVTAVFARAFSAAYGSLTFDEIIKVTVAGMAGKLSGAATTTVAIRNLADSADVIVATVDASGNRSAVTVTP